MRGIGGFDGHTLTEPGAVYGLRGWDISTRAAVSVMRGMYGYDWADGMNVARCEDGRQPPCPPPPAANEAELAALCELSSRLRFRHAALQGAEHLACGPTEERQLVAKRERIGKALALVRSQIVTRASTCECGFWAYWATADVLAAPFRPMIRGVIEGSGMVQFGERGFRCERARIVALCPGMIPEALKLAAPLYPSAQVFADMEMMLAEFPASATQALSEGEKG